MGRENKIWLVVVVVVHKIVVVVDIFVAVHIGLKCGHQKFIWNSLRLVFVVVYDVAVVIGVVDVAGLALHICCSWSYCI